MPQMKPSMWMWIMIMMMSMTTLIMMLNFFQPHQKKKTTTNLKYPVTTKWK